MFQKTPLKRVRLSRTLNSLFLGVLSIATILYGDFAFHSQPTYAATTSTVNFQARLEGAGGSIAADGLYNIRFKLYSVSSGGAALWSEAYYDANGVTAGQDNRVQVTNGYVTVQLGSQTALSGINADQGLYLTMDIGGTAQTATPTYDGEMSPRLQISAVPYAFRAGQLAIGNGFFESTLSIIQPTVGNQNFQIADQGAAGTYQICVQGSTSGCNAASGSGFYIQNQNSGVQTTSNFWLSGSGRADTSLLSPLVDASTAGALGIGTGATSTSINIGGTSTTTTTIAATTTLNLNAPLIATNASSLILFNTVTSAVTALGAATTIDLGASSGSTYIHNPTLNLGGSGITSIIGAGNAGLLVDTAAYSAASSSSGLVTVRSGNVSGATSNTGAVNFKSGNSTTSGNTGIVTIQSGDATSGNSGDITIDVGSATATKGNINIGTGLTGTGTVNIGSTGTTSKSTALNLGSTTSTGGANTIQIGGTGVTNGSNTSTTIKTQAGQTALSLATAGATLQTFSNSSTAFQIQNASAQAIFNVDTSGNNITIGKAGTGGINGKLSLATTNASNFTSTITVSALQGSQIDYTLPTTIATTGDCLKAGTVSASSVPLVFAACGGGGGANLTLSNLTGPTAINTDLTFANGVSRTISIAQAASGVGNSLSVVAGQSGTGANNGGDLVLQAGATGGSGTTGSVTVKANGTNSATAFQVQNAAGTNLLAVDTVNTTLALGSSATQDVFTKLSDPATLPGATANGTAFSPDGQYMSVATSSSPYITIYKRSGDTFTKLPDPATLPAATGKATAFSPDGQYMSVATSSSPYITIYRRSGDTFTKIADPALLPGSGGNGVAFSPDGQYMSVASTNLFYIAIYKIDETTDTFTKLTNPSLPGLGAQTTAFSADGQYMSVATNNPTYISIYKRSGDTFTKLADPATAPGTIANGTAFSPDGQYMTVSSNSTPYITIYERSGDTFTKLPDPATLPGSASRGTTFSPDGLYMTVTSTSSPYVTIYKVTKSTDTFTKLTDPATLPGATGNGTAFSPDGQYMTVASTSSPYITIYKHGTTTSVNGTLNVGNGIAVAGRVSGVDAVNANEYATLGQLNSLLNTSNITLSAGLNTTVSGVAGVFIGSPTIDANQVNLQLDSSSAITETASTCTATANQGALYYNTATNAIRSCINGAWEDVVTTAGLGILLFGIVPDSTATSGTGDLAGAAGYLSGPCRVYITASQNIIAWNSCTAYSGGRKYQVSAGTTTIAAGTNLFQNLCLDTTGTPVLVGTANVADTTAGLYPSFSVAAPTLCLATIKTATASNKIAWINDTRTYTTSLKTFATMAGAASLGAMVKSNGTLGQFRSTAAVTDQIAGVLVAYSGTVSTTTPNAVIVTSGPVAVQAISGTVGQIIEWGSGLGVGITIAAATTATNPYVYAGIAQNAWSGLPAGCTASTVCSGSLFTYLTIR